MGKIRRVRQKYHASLAKGKDEDKGASSDLTRETPKLVATVEGTAAEGPGLSGNLFAGLQIKFDESKSLPVCDKMSDVDNMSVVSSGRRTREGSKKERKKKRHEEFLQKIDAIHAGKKAEKERRQREKTVIVGDVQPMMNALPSLEELLTATKVKKGEQKSIKSRGTPKQKKAQKEFLSDIQMFMAVNQDPIFNKDPIGAVSQAVENRIKYSEEDS